LFIQTISFEFHCVLGLGLVFVFFEVLDLGLVQDLDPNQRPKFFWVKRLVASTIFKVVNTVDTVFIVVIAFLVGKVTVVAVIITIILVFIAVIVIFTFFIVVITAYTVIIEVTVVIID
jgi:hypothetical protein